MYIAAGYTYADTKYFSGRDELYLNDVPSQSVLGIVGVEPKFFIFDWLSLGTQLGLQYTYTYSKTTFNVTENSGSSVNVINEPSTAFTNNFKLFGSIALSSALVAFVYF
jgi:hypothetical protein